MTNIDKIKNLEIGHQIDLKLNLSTYTFYRVDENNFELDCTSGSWISSKATLKELEDIFSGNKSMLDLNWK